MKKIAIFASGNGSNAENIIAYFSGRDDVRISLVLTNKADAHVLTRARNHGIPSFVFTPTQLRESGLVLQKLLEYDINFIVLAGFLLKVPVNILEAFPMRIVNIHPALLPNYGGKGMYGMKVHEAVISNGDTESGITIHYVNEYYDDGMIIFQAKCTVTPDDTPDSLAYRIHQMEYEFFPAVIDKIISSQRLG